MIIINKVFLILIVIFTVNIIKIASQDKAVTQTKESQSVMTSDSAWQILKEGNRRFVEGKTHIA